jgi:hypothetical protein
LLNFSRHIEITDSSKDQVKPAQKALRIIWVTGIVCVSTSFIFFFKTGNNNGLQNQLVSGKTNNEISSIDQLLLTSEESLLEDKKSFVNGALRFQWRNQLPDLNQENNRTILYNNILNKKLQRLPKAKVTDFSVKPVPH